MLYPAALPERTTKSRYIFCAFIPEMLALKNWLVKETCRFAASRCDFLYKHCVREKIITFIGKSNDNDSILRNWYMVLPFAASKQRQSHPF